MGYFEAQPPSSSYVPPDAKRLFRRLLEDIAAMDRKNGTHTPSATVLLIIDTAGRFGVPPSELVVKGG
jgi:hypothetical protein